MMFLRNIVADLEKQNNQSARTDAQRLPAASKQRQTGAAGGEKPRRNTPAPVEPRIKTSIRTPDSSRATSSAAVASYTMPS